MAWTALCNFIGVVILTSLISCKTGETISQVRGAESDSVSLEQQRSRLIGLLDRLKTATTAEARDRAYKAVWSFVVEQDRNGRMDDLIRFLVDTLPQTAEASAKEKKAVEYLVYNSLKIEIANRDQFESWESVASRLVNAVQGTAEMEFTSALEHLGNTSFLPVDQAVRLLIDGPASWRERDRLLATAKKSIWIFSWAFYNDQTGNEAIGKLIEMKRKNPELDIRIMVDGPTQSKPGYTESVDRLNDANVGIELIRWTHPRLTGYGMHRKAMIIDHGTSDAAMVFGGMNYGDNYSYLNRELTEVEKWRDTDMFATGDLANQQAHYFAKAWNAFVAEPGDLASSPVLTQVEVPSFPRSTGRSANQMAIVDQDASLILEDSSYLDPVYAATIKMIDNARSTVEISNAYFITSLPIEQAFMRALNRGVKIRVHTNSFESLVAEEKMLLGPIYGSLRDLMEGYSTEESENKDFADQIEIYLQQARTLHSKYLVIDGMYGWIGSYNIHPRSYRLESENVAIFHGADIGEKMHEMFEADVQNSTKAAYKDLVTPDNPLLTLVEKFIFNQL